MSIRKSKVRRTPNDAERRRAFFYDKADADVFEVSSDPNTFLCSVMYYLPDPIKSLDKAVTSARCNATERARQLLNAGFSEVTCLFQYRQVGVLFPPR